MKNLYFILVAVFCFTIATSCSSDDNETNTIVESNFLEKYQGTVWHIAINEFNSEFVMFHNNETVPFEQWLLLSGVGCYENYSYNINEFNATITENSEELLQITFDSGHVWIIGVEGDLLFWVDVSEEGIMEYIYDKQSSEVLDDLEICE
jgi:hypothetical protein